MDEIFCLQYWELCLQKVVHGVACEVKGCKEAAITTKSTVAMQLAELSSDTFQVCRMS